MAFPSIQAKSSKFTERKTTFKIRLSSYIWIRKNKILYHRISYVGGNYEVMVEVVK